METSVVARSPSTLYRWLLGSTLPLPARARSGLPDLAYQEIWAWLIVHYAIAVLIARAAEAADIDPDRISFTRALRIIRRTATGTADIPPSALD